jgi:peptidoglycan/LPS O-acetylase OafA/YrhL
MRNDPLLFIGVGLGAAGTAKLAGANFTRANFERWGYPGPARFVVGGIEVGVAATALAALGDRQSRPVAALGTLCTMAGAIATHAHAGDSAPNYVPAAAFVAAAVAVLAGR